MLAAYESAVGALIFNTEKVDCYYAYTNNMAVRMSLLKSLGGFRHLERGADTLFLRDALAQYSPSIVQYAPAVVVRHLEISRVEDYLRKKGIYGRVDGRRGMANRRALPLIERMALALRIKRESGASIAMNIGFLGSLAAGAARFEWEMGPQRSECFLRQPRACIECVGHGGAYCADAPRLGGHQALT
jgi:hypothetical protein